jgi:hypothetical protein
MCMKRYSRTHINPKNVDLYCQFRTNHTGDHSWQDIKAADDSAEEVDVPLVEVPDPDEVETMERNVLTLVHAIDRGAFDPYLEVLLAAAHDRKRTLRGVRLFPRLAQ